MLVQFSSVLEPGSQPLFHSFSFVRMRVSNKAQLAVSGSGVNKYLVEKRKKMHHQICAIQYAFFPLLLLM